MKVNGKAWRTIWPIDNTKVGVIDQKLLPHKFETVELANLDDACRVISDMTIRGAPLIGATAAYGLCLAANTNPSMQFLEEAGIKLCATRPTAINLKWAVDLILSKLKNVDDSNRAQTAWELAAKLCDDDVETNRAIGNHGLELIQEIANKKNNEVVNILTHCNAGWLATVDIGTATAPIYQAFENDIKIHVWVDETRPRNQGAFLTAWELNSHGVPHTVLADNAGGHLMQHGQVDICIVGTDRTTASGDVCNKIGTYLKALAAKDNNVPFYVALPSSTIDPKVDDGVAEIPIENRSETEVTHISGIDDNDEVTKILLTPKGSPALNPGFDVTPAHLVTGLITERGVVNANREDLANKFPELY